MTSTLSPQSSVALELCLSDGQQSTNSASAAEIEPNPNEAATLEFQIDSTFLDTLRRLGGVNDRWLSLLRRVDKQAAMLTFVWIGAVLAGLHRAASGMNAELLAAYALALGYTSHEDRDKFARHMRDGLENLRAKRLLITQASSPLLCSKLEDDFDSEDDGARSKPYEPKILERSDPMYFWQPFTVVREVVEAGYAKPRVTRWAYPTEAHEDREPVRIDLGAEHFVGEYGATLDEAETIASDIAAYLKPIDDKPMQHRRKEAHHKTDKAFARIRLDLSLSKCCTPLAEGTFHIYSEFDVLRYRGAVEHIPEASTWSQGQWVSFLGVSRGTVINLRADAGLKTEQRFELLPLHGGDIQQQVEDHLKRSGGGKPIKMQIYDPLTQTKSTRAYTVEAAEQYRTRGCAVEVLIQKSSITKIDPDGPRPRKRNEKRKEGTSQPMTRQKSYDGPGYSCAWLLGQLRLNLTASGYPESEVMGLALADAIRLARGQANAEVDHIIPTSRTREAQSRVPMCPELTQDCPLADLSDSHKDAVQGDHPLHNTGEQLPALDIPLKNERHSDH